MVVRRCLSGVPQPLSGDCELRRAGALSGTQLASCRGNSPGESQYLLLAYAAVLGSDPHVRHILRPLLICRKQHFLPLLPGFHALSLSSLFQGDASAAESWRNAFRYGPVQDVVLHLQSARGDERHYS